MSDQLFASLMWVAIVGGGLLGWVGVFLLGGPTVLFFSSLIGIAAVLIIFFVMRKWLNRR